MRILQRKYRGEADLLVMAALANALPTHNLHVSDLPYRLSSWAIDCPENIGLWVDGKGELVGWAMMQTPFWVIDYAYHAHAAPGVHGRILAWADERARAALGTTNGRPMWFINVFTDQMHRRQDLEEAGFASQADVGENSCRRSWCWGGPNPPKYQRWAQALLRW